MPNPAESSGANDAATLGPFLDFATRFATLSHSQILQDLWVIWEIGIGRPGTFVDIGAADGVFLNNTYLLERMGWTGLLVEANANFQEKLASARKAPIAHRAIWSETGLRMTLRSVDEYMELSRLDAVTAVDKQEAQGQRSEFHEQSIESIRLEELLEQHRLPGVIDYMNIDIEGAEYEALKNFDFDKYKFRCMTIEHNFTPERDEIHALLKKHGYRRKWEQLSAWDDWYVYGGDVTPGEPVSAFAKEAHRRLFELRLQRDEKPEAAALALAATRHWQDDGGLVSGMATKLLSLGYVDQAEDMVKGALERSPDLAQAHFLHAMVLKQKERPDEAVAASARAVELAPERWAWRNVHGHLLASVGRHQDSIEALSAVPESEPQFAAAQLRISRSYEALDQVEDALRTAERAVAASGDNEAAMQHLERIRSRSSAQ